ncbi:hypothetical protein NE237_013052 [Protea cynaroides]|uniref:Uncharacterized protein n=1 Tax=Protea cynaroides TaxID=273540 RepID=A0A9Q0JXG3_9MAGN|nr:hypothetical protein NE237_013052 [Protea cynaroides]
MGASESASVVLGKDPLPSVVLGDDPLEFLRRMNRTYVNDEGRYIKFQFRSTMFSGLQELKDNILRYYDKDYLGIAPFSQVQCNSNEKVAALRPSKVQLPNDFIARNDGDASWIINEALGSHCAFTYNSYCFIGFISSASGNFHNNDVVKKFFDENNLGPNCFVDATGTTFVVLNGFIQWWKSSPTDKVVPAFVDE